MAFSPIFLTFWYDSDNQIVVNLNFEGCQRCEGAIHGVCYGQASSVIFNSEDCDLVIQSVGSDLSLKNMMSLCI